MNTSSFKHDFSKVAMKRKSFQSYVKSIFIAQTQQEIIQENNQQNDILQKSQTLQKTNLSSQDIKSSSQLYFILNIEDIIQTQQMIQISLTEDNSLQKNCRTIDSFKTHQSNSKNNAYQDQMNCLIVTLEKIQKQQSIQFTKLNLNIQFSTSSQHQDFFHQFLKKLENRKIIAISIPFQTNNQNKETQMLGKSLIIKKLVVSKKLLSFLGHGVNQTCVNLKKYGLIALQILSKDLVSKICYHYKKTLNEYNKLFIKNQVSRQNLKKFCSCILKEDIKFKKTGSKSLYQIFKANCEIFVPGPGIVIIEIVQKQSSSDQKKTQKFQFEKIQQIYRQHFNETQSLNHIIKLPHSKIFPKDARICTYRQVDIQK